MCSTRGGSRERRRDRRRRSRVLAPTQWMNRRSSPRTFTTRVWLVGSSRVDHERTRVDVVCLERLGRKPAEDVVADTGADGRRHAEPGEVDRGVGGAAADVEHQLVDRDQLAGSSASDRIGGHRWSATTSPAQTTGAASVERRSRHGEVPGE